MATKRIYAMHDSLDDDKVVFTGDQLSCAEFADTSGANITSSFRRKGKVKGRYWLEHVDDVKKTRKNFPKIPKRHERCSIIDAVMIRDVVKLRRSTRIGTEVRCFEYFETTHEKNVIGEFPITEKYRHVFSVQMTGHLESYSWIDLYRKDGVELIE